MALYLGIDTSNYTSSVAAVNDCGEIITDERILLSVEQGKRGLRQSDALFLHTKNLPLLFERFSAHEPIASVGVSSAPRRTEDSYMPVFLAGVSVAHAIAATHAVPLFSFSHQEGHIRAGLHGLAQDFPSDFYAVHLSGGTTEILSVQKENHRYQSTILGGTEDISAGQLIDRVGVALGLSFPCGKALDTLSRDSTSKIPFKISTSGCSFHFSGIEAQALRALEHDVCRADLANSVFLAIAETLSHSFCALFREHGKKPLLLAGGVASNSILRDYLAQEFSGLIFFAEPHYATDNAVGIALLTKEQSQ